MINWINSLDKNLLSFVIPTYNRPEFLNSCLKHIGEIHYELEGMHGPRVEVVVVDDGSSQDNMINNDWACTKCGDDFGVKIGYIYLSQNSGSVSIPRNIGISHISGRTIAPTDDDCFPRLEKITLFNKLWENDKNLLSYGGRSEFVADSNGDFQHRGNVTCENHNPKEVGIDNGQFVYKADVYQWIPPQFAINACDWELYRKIADYGNFVYCPEIVCDYLWHGQNMSLTPKHKRVNPLSKLRDYLPYFKDGEFKDACANLLDS